MEKRKLCNNCEYHKKVTFGNKDNETEMRYGCEKTVNIYQFEDMFVIDCEMFVIDCEMFLSNVPPFTDEEMPF